MLYRIYISISRYFVPVGTYASYFDSLCVRYEVQRSASVPALDCIFYTTTENINCVSQLHTIPQYKKEVIPLNTPEKDLKELIKEYLTTDYIHADDIPNIELYMDQVTTFMDQHLSNTKRYEEDKILTKTMINNYSKNDILPPSNKKKYSKNHLLLLIFIYYYKSFLSITDIKKLLTPLIETFFDKEVNGIDLEAIYRELVSFEKEHMKDHYDNIEETFQFSQTIFKDLPAEEQKLLNQFTFICLLSYDIYLKKQLVEKLIDDLFSPTKDEKKKEKDK